MLTSIRYVLLCALRDRLFLGLMLGTVAIALIASLLGGTAFLEEKEMSLAYAGAASRLMLAVGMVVFVCFHIRSAFDSREIDVMLSRPVSRHGLIGAYWLGFAVVAALLLLPVAAVLVVIHPLSVKGAMAFLLSELLELWFVVALSLCAALVLKSAVMAVLSSFGFYLLSRMMTFFVMTAESPEGEPSQLLLWCKQVVIAISTVLPRMDFFAKTQWLVYGIEGQKEWALFLAQAGIFIPLLLTVAAVDFRRKQF